MTSPQRHLTGTLCTSHLQLLLGNTFAMCPPQSARTEHTNLNNASLISFLLYILGVYPCLYQMLQRGLIWDNHLCTWTMFLAN